jgi:oligopeptidase B
VLDPRIRDYLDAENAYTEKIMAPVGALRRALFAEMKGRIKQDDSTVPKPDGPYGYYRRFESDGQHPVYCRIPQHREGAEERLLDGNREAQGQDFFKIASCEHSPDHRHAAYAVDLKGSEFHTIRIKDLNSGELLDDRLECAQGGVVWANDSRTLFYTVLDPQHRPSKILRHRLGTPCERDEVIYHEPDAGFFLGLDKTESRRFITISAHDHTTSEVRLIDADDPLGEPRLVAKREPGIEYEMSDHGGRFLILTNADGALDFKIVEAPLEAPGRDNWRDHVAHDPGRLILDILVFRDYLVRLERHQGLPRIVVTAFADQETHTVAFDEEAYDLAISPGYEFDSPVLRFHYSSMTTPARVYDYDMAARTRRLRKEQEVPSGHDPEAYVTRRIFAEGHDGEKVPVSLLYGRDTPLDGSAPLLLYGYGAYGHAIPAAFSPSRFSLVDRGFIYAIAHVRGGTEKGYAWYLDGKKEKKTNSFDDFISAAEALVAGRFTQAGRIAAHGGSAGGMLVGAVANKRPDLFNAVIAEVPFVDVLTTMCDAELPLTPPEWPEWGNPIDDEAAYRTIASYSPYDNVEAKAYPHILATAGLTDPRVTYWEPAKWVAKLRAMKSDANFLLLKTNMTAGHAGAAGRFDKLEEVALVYAFTLQVFGMSEEGSS